MLLESSDFMPNFVEVYRENSQQRKEGMAFTKFKHKPHV
jgi:hypothetical protein